MNGIHTRVLLLLFALTGLVGCGDGDACFGLCSKDDDDDAPAAPTIDRSCYADASLSTAETFTYAETDPTANQILSFESVASASATTLRPVLIWVTGDTWSSNNSTNDVPDRARLIARELGSHLAIVEYRSGGSTEWPEPVQDIRTAIRFLKTQASDLNIDVDNLFLAGDQAGGHLAALAGLTNGIQEFEGSDHAAQTSQVAGVLTFGAVFDFRTLVQDSEAIEQRCGALPAIAIEPVKDLFDCADAVAGDDPLAECDANRLELASTSFHISSDDPPLLVWHGAQDCMVPSNQSTEFTQALEERSTDFSFTLLQNDDDQLDSLTASSVEEELAQLVTCDG